jgi:hypothetical protein
LDLEEKNKVVNMFNENPLDFGLIEYGNKLILKKSNDNDYIDANIYCLKDFILQSNCEKSLEKMKWKSKRCIKLNFYKENLFV